MEQITVGGVNLHHLEAGFRRAAGRLGESFHRILNIREGKADFIALARVFLKDPYWVLNAAQALGVDMPWPAQYVRVNTLKK